MYSIRFALIIFGVLLWHQEVKGAEISFEEAQARLKGHELVSSLEHRSQALAQRAEIDGAWGDPMFSIGANNLPIEHQFKRDVTPMSGIVFGVAQKFPLGPRLSQKRAATKKKAERTKVESELLLEQIAARLWINLISTRRTQGDLQYLRENERWIESMVKVSKKLYSNGKISQQALLDIQIRHNQVKSQKSQKVAELSALRAEQSFLLGENDWVQLKSVPWTALRNKPQGEDLKVKSLEYMVQSTELERSAAKWARIPEVTLGLNYIKRENIDSKGDFASIMISFPLAFGSSRGASEASANQEWLAAQSELRSYHQERASKLRALKQKRDSLLEQERLTLSSLRFARTARETSAKSYRLGALSYFDLLQAELRQQELEFQANEFEAKIALNYLEEKLIYSDVLVEMEN